MVRKLVVLGEIAIDHVSGTWRLGGASYAARAAASTGAEVVLAGPLMSDVPAADLASLERLSIRISKRAQGASARYIMLGTGPGEARSTVSVPGTALASIIEEPADAYLILASPGLDLEAALASARRHAPLVALDGHRDDMVDPRWRGVLRDVDMLLLNLEDAVTLGDGDPLAAPRRLGRTDRVTVIKHGRGGLTAFENSARLNIGAYAIVMRDKVGAGDTLIGATLARRLQGDALDQALRYGAAAAAHHIEVGTVSEPGHVEDVLGRECVYVSPEQLNVLVYVASPFFTTSEQMPLRRVVRGLEAAGVRVASPSRDIGILRPDASAEQARAAFVGDLDALNRSAAVVALLDQDDTGTAWEIGYAYAKGIPVVGIRTDVRAAANNMLVHSVEIARGMDELLRLLFRSFAR